MKISKYLVVALGFSVLIVKAQVPKINFSEFDLPNGLHVILEEDHATPIVAVGVLYHVGSKNEDAQRTGFAHFFEHLMFEGSANIKRGEYMKLIQNNGGILNANTSFDRTYYYHVLPSSQLELGLWMESERMLHAKIDAEGVETQRKVVTEELNQRNNNTPYGSILNEAFSHSFKLHPYRWTPGGSPEYINKAKIQEFVDFYKLFYVPNNATLSISGDINVAQAKELITMYFAPIPKGTQLIPRPKIVEPASTAEQRDTVYDNIQLPAVVMAYHMPAQGTPDYYAMDLLSTLLSNGKSSRLQKNVVDKKQKAVYAGSFPIPTEDPGLALMFGISNMGISPVDLEAAIDEEVEKVKTETVTDEDFQKLLNQLESQFVSKNASVMGRAENLANYHVYYGSANLINNEIERYLKVTKDDLKRVANKYLAKTNRVVLYYLPKEKQN